jgi:hypothetical protein
MNSSAAKDGLDFASHNQLQELLYINLQLAALGQISGSVPGQTHIKIFEKQCIIGL